MTAQSVSRAQRKSAKRKTGDAVQKAFQKIRLLQTALKNPAVCELKCTQVIVNREEMLGRYHYLRAGNPVFIISFTGAGDR